MNVRSSPGRTRRDALRVGAGVFGLGLSQLLELEARAAPAENRRPPAKAVILVWLPGGPSHLDLWDPKPDAPAEVRGEFATIPTKADGVRVCEYLPRTAAVMGRCALVRSLAHTIPDHLLATQFMTTGNRPTPVLSYPALGSVAARLAPAERGVPSYVALPGAGDAYTRTAGGGYLGPGYDPFAAEVVRVAVPGRGLDPRVDAGGVVLPPGFTADQLDRRRRLARGFDRGFAAGREGAAADGLDAFQEQAADLLRSPRTRDALDLEREADGVRDRYGRTPFGQGCLAARRLVEAGVRFVTVSTAGLGWDTHVGGFAALRALLPDLDRSLAGLVGDLDDRGLLDSTVVYCAGEFGRTPKVNAGGGRDHWARAMSVLLAGGGFKRGHVYGSTDAQGAAPASDPCTPDDLAATVLHRLGIDPHQELLTPSGRPVQLFRDGHVLSGLVG